MARNMKWEKLLFMFAHKRENASVKSLDSIGYLGATASIATATYYAELRC